MRTVLITHGIALLILSLFLTPPLILELIENNNHWQPFLTTISLSLFLGLILILSNKRTFLKLNIRSCFVLTASVWVGISLISAIPYFLTQGNYHLSAVDAIFESMSGLTTTGSTVYQNLDYAPKGILLWRSLTEWIGGIGLIVFSMTVMPYLRVGGMQLFKMESSEKFTNIISDARKLAKIIFTIYILLTAANFIAYYFAGMEFFDAINHALTTISTGGFSTHDASFGYFESSKLEWIATFFMIAGGTPMLLYYIYFRGKRISFSLMSQAKFLYKGLFATILITATWLYFNSDFGILDSVRMCAFNIVSIVTTTGFATTDYSKWGNSIIMFFFLLTMIGGCAGSTSGGIKIFRIQILFRYLAKYINHLIQPQETYNKKINYKWMNDEIIKDTMIFMIMFMVVFLLVSLGLSLTGLDFITSLSGSATAIANVGPGLGDIIGPSGNFSSLPDMSKYILIFAMLAGRLEILFIFVLLSKVFWIRKRKEAQSE